MNHSPTIAMSQASDKLTGVLSFSEWELLDYFPQLLACTTTDHVIQYLIDFVADLSLDSIVHLIESHYITLLNVKLFLKLINDPPKERSIFSILDNIRDSNAKDKNVSHMISIIDDSYEEAKETIHQHLKKIKFSDRKRGQVAKVLEKDYNAGNIKALFFSEELKESVESVIGWNKNGDI